jgi:mono/diheme cytochrome c family protein
MMRQFSILGLAMFALGVHAVPIRAADPAEPADKGTAQQRQEFFEKRVRPVLVEHCHECHGPGSKVEGDLRVDSRAALLSGGASGPAVKPGDPKASLLVEAINHGGIVQMPPKNKLPPAAIADLTAWVADGAYWPGDSPTVAAKRATAPARPFTLDQRQHWAFQPTIDTAPPEVADASWAVTAIDRFILAALESKQLTPAPPADKRTLIRRATFDLHGLPPTPAEVADFLADSSPRAFERVVERLLASPRYGERWGRHWLDLARYADSNGMDENMAMAHAWRYRDWVIRAFNRDLPYDQFVREQIAGDLLPSPDEQETLDRLVATGFLVLGPKMLAEDDPVKMEMDIIDEQVDTIGRTFMGMTLGCARCHDHKYDPISSSDYYALAGIFKSTRTMENYRVVAMWSERPLAVGPALAELTAHEQRTEDAKRALKTLEAEAADVAAAGAESLDVGRAKESVDRAKQDLERLEKQKPDLPRALAVAERDVQDLRVHLRGSHLTLGELAPRQFPRVLAGDAQPPMPSHASGRLELACWLTRGDHPLTSRVMVNRIWQAHFGDGLVRTSDNFGLLGERPDHPALMDWLARHFVKSGWSIKQMHRLIMRSSVYRMSAKYDEQSAQLDPENRLRWRASRRRLEAEEIRDAIVAVGGGVDPAMGGTLLSNRNHTYVTSTASINDVKYDNQRRSVYLPVVRSAIYEVLSAFDFADPSMSNGKRPTTTVAPQALFMMNSLLIERQTRAMAQRLLSDAVASDGERVASVYECAYGRPPRPEETRRALAFVAEYQSHLLSQNVAEANARERAWQALCRVIVSSNEFVHVE